MFELKRGELLSIQLYSNSRNVLSSPDEQVRAFPPRRQNDRYLVHNDLSAKIYTRGSQFYTANVLDIGKLGAYVIFTSKISFCPRINKQLLVSFEHEYTSLTSPLSASIRHITQHTLIDFTLYGLGLLFDNDLESRIQSTIDSSKLSSIITFSND